MKAELTRNFLTFAATLKKTSASISIKTSSPTETFLFSSTSMKISTLTSYPILISTSIKISTDIQMPISILLFIPNLEMGLTLS